MEYTMNTTQTTDTLSITIYNPYYELNDILINKWYSDNNITQYSTTNKQGHSYNQLQINGIDIARAYHRPKIIGYNQHQAKDKANYIQGTLSINFAGLKSYNQINDNIKLKALTNLLHILQDNNIAFKSKRVDIATDIHNSNYDNIAALRINKQGYKHQFNKPSQSEYSTTFYLEQYTPEPSVKALIYDKTLKEYNKHKNIIESGIVRMEISIRTTQKQHKAISTKEQYINHIQKQINKYLFTECPSKNTADTLKSAYELAIDNGTKNLSALFKTKANKLNAKIINTTLTEQTKELLTLSYCENFNDKLKATYTEPEINLSSANKERKERKQASAQNLKPLSKQQKLFIRALKKRWSAKSATAKSTKTKVTLELLKSFKSGSIFQHQSNTLF